MNPAFTVLADAAKQVGEIACYINEHVRQHENFQKMLSIQNSFDNSAPNILEPGREFIREGPLKKVNIVKVLSRKPPKIF